MEPIHQYPASEPRSEQLRHRLIGNGVISIEREQDVWEAVTVDMQGEHPRDAIVYVVGLVRRYAIRVTKGKDLQPVYAYVERLLFELEDFLPSMEMMEATGEGKPAYERTAKYVEAAGRICEQRIFTNSF